MSDFEMTVDAWESLGDVKYADREATWKYFFEAGQSSAEQRVKELELQRDEWNHLAKELDKQLRTEIGKLQAECAELERKMDYWRDKAKDLLKAQAGEPEPTCPYCKNYSTLGSVYYDQNCMGCVKRMSNTHPTTERRVIPEDVLSWIDGVLPVIEIFGTTPSQKQWSKDRTREARAWLNAAPAPKEMK